MANGNIVDEINGIIASRDSIRTTMVGAGVTGVTNSSKLADLAVNLANAKLPAATYNIEASGSITIPAGKLTTGNQTITAKSLASQTPGTAAAGDILSGKIAWVDGAKVTGNIATVTPSATSLNCGDSATIAEGYLASDVKITANSLASQTSGTAAAGDILSGKTAWVGGTQLTGSMPNATITSGSATISSATYTYNSSNGNFSVTGSATIAAPSVGTAGYISSSAGTRKANTATLSATVAKIAGSTSITGTTTKQPSISRQSISISNVTDAAAGDAQTSAPSSGVWVKVKSGANTGTLTATPSVSTEGYGTGSYHGIAAASATVGASESADTYIPIKTGDYSASVVSITAGSASMSATGVSTASSSNCYITLSTSAGSATGTATIGTAGWVAAGSTSSSPSSVSVSGNGTRLYLATYTPSTITVTNSSQTIPTSGKVCTGNITIPAINYYYTSLEAPSDSEGNNGDIWLVVNPDA